MKYFFSLLVVSIIVFSCKKEETVANINVAGYWNVKDPTYTTAGRDLYHLFRYPNAYYRFSFDITHDFSVLTSTPKSDSLISFFKVEGRELKLPSPSPSITVTFPGITLQSLTDNEMIFIRNVITKRDLTTGAPFTTRTDTVKYLRVVDPVKVAYFDNYLKRWHP